LEAAQFSHASNSGDLFSLSSRATDNPLNGLC